MQRLHCMDIIKMIVRFNFFSNLVRLDSSEIHHETSTLQTFE